MEQPKDNALALAADQVASPPATVVTAAPTVVRPMTKRERLLLAQRKQGHKHRFLSMKMDGEVFDVAVKCPSITEVLSFADAAKKNLSSYSAIIKCTFWAKRSDPNKEPDIVTDDHVYEDADINWMSTSTDEPMGGWISTLRVVIEDMMREETERALAAAKK